jgi:hypothetical protein
MPGGLIEHIAVSDLVLADLARFMSPCRQRVLIVADGDLNFSTTDQFGLARLVDALRGNSPSPTITLAHRSGHAASVTIGGVVYPVISNFNFHTAVTNVTTANYDQVWLFGFRTGPGGPDPNNVQPLTSQEINRLGTFMNAGGGVFATGDHATLGQGMGAELPRIRRMREWAAIPMGLEGNLNARNRIDTVVDPGPGDNLYQFEDQADSVPQRIYPNYQVTYAGTVWTANIHRLLAMPGAPVNRTNSAGFTNDMDVLPDHPHESVCYEVSSAVNPAQLNGTYNAHGLNFAEFPNAATAGARIGSQIVAYGVSGGRSVNNGGAKPPVNPRMFGIISAFDGHAGAPYSGTVRPGRIVCDSTWHHFVNVNIDGTGTARSGLGTVVGGTWTPSAACQKVFQYYRNILAWLPPSNRISCWIFADLIAIQAHPLIVEEIVQLPDPPRPDQVEALGAEVARILEMEEGPGAAVAMVRTALRLDPSSSALADSEDADLLTRRSGGPGQIVTYALGKAVFDLSRTFPVHSEDQFAKALKGRRHDAVEQDAVRAIASAAAEAAEMQISLDEQRLRVLSAASPRRCKPQRPG